MGCRWNDRAEKRSGGKLEGWGWMDDAGGRWMKWKCPGGLRCGKKTMNTRAFDCDWGKNGVQERSAFKEVCRCLHWLAKRSRNKRVVTVEFMLCIRFESSFGCPTPYVCCSLIKRKRDLLMWVSAVAVTCAVTDLHSEHINWDWQREWGCVRETPENTMNVRCCKMM